MNKSGLKPACLSTAEALRVRDAFVKADTNLLLVWDKGDGLVLDARAGARISIAIEEMVKVAKVVHPDPVNLQAELNSKIVCAHAMDNPHLLYQAWERAPFHGLQLVKLEFDFSNPEEEIPRNNDGREKCYWCGSPTRPLDLATSTGNVCPKCGR